MIATAVPWYATDPMFFFVPGLFLFLTVLSFTVFGDHLSRAIDTGETQSDYVSDPGDSWRRPACCCSSPC